jgi:hypothetical protein
VGFDPTITVFDRAKTVHAPVILRATTYFFQIPDSSLRILPFDVVLRVYRQSLKYILPRQKKQEKTLNEYFLSFSGEVLI